MERGQVTREVLGGLASVVVGEVLDVLISVDLNVPVHSADPRTR